jgi:hypothetical protein
VYKAGIIIGLPLPLPLSLPDGLEFSLAGVAELALLSAAAAAQEELTDARHVAHTAPHPILLFKFRSECWFFDWKPKNTGNSGQHKSSWLSFTTLLPVGDLLIADKNTGNSGQHKSSYSSQSSFRLVICGIEGKQKKSGTRRQNKSYYASQSSFRLLIYWLQAKNARNFF